MSKQTHHTSPRFWTCIVLLLAAAFGCKLSSLTGHRMNLFEGTNAQDGATKLKEKIGVEFIKLTGIEIHEDRMEMWVQAPNSEKNVDKYVFSDGTLTGPERLDPIALGNNQDSTYKMRIFDLSEVNLAAIADVCRKAVERAKIEQGKVDSISIALESADRTRTKDEAKRRDADDKELPLPDFVNKRLADSAVLTVTWRIWVKGSGEIKDFWADKRGNLLE